MKLFHDYVAIEPDKIPDKTASGLYLNNQIKTYPPYGTIRHVAPSISDLKPGDRVVYKVYASIDVNLDPADVQSKKVLTVIPYSGVIAKIL